MAIQLISLQGQPVQFKIDEGPVQECRPRCAKEPCVPEDWFDMIEICKVCGVKF